MNKAIGKLSAQIDSLLERQQRVVIAIDGNCTAGKTTLACILSKEYDCNVFHMDDYFLRPSQRTPERLAQPGGNVDYERFWDEILSRIRNDSSFSYRPYDCGKKQLSGSVAVTPKRLSIVEGTYSQHPYFQDAYDLRVFLSVPSQLQAERIRQRPENLHNRFFEAWIPMEQQYFEAFAIPAKSDLVLNLSEE